MENRNKLKIGKIIKKGRERCDLNLSQLASITKLTESTIQSLEEDNAVSDQIAMRVAGILLKRYRTMCFIDETTLAASIRVVPSEISAMERGIFKNIHLFEESITALNKMVGFDEQIEDNESQQKSQRLNTKNNSSFAETKVKKKKSTVPNTQSNNNSSKKGKSRLIHKSPQKNKEKIKNAFIAASLIREKENKQKTMSHEKKVAEIRRKAEALMRGEISLVIENRNKKTNTSYLPKKKGNQEKTGKKESYIPSYYYQKKGLSANTLLGQTNKSNRKITISPGVHGDYETL